MTYQLAQINIARMRGVNINDPIMKEFVENLDAVNAIAEKSVGFVWRLKDENNSATSLNPYDDEQILINVSVWERIEALEQFTFKSYHTDILKRRREWFQTIGKVYVAMWWVRNGEFPTVHDAVEKLEYLQVSGPTAVVFDFRKNTRLLKCWSGL